jgi:hypothetical protein
LESLTGPNKEKALDKSPKAFLESMKIF